MSKSSPPTLTGCEEGSATRPSKMSGEEKCKECGSFLSTPSQTAPERNCDKCGRTFTCDKCGSTIRTSTPTTGPSVAAEKCEKCAVRCKACGNIPSADARAGKPMSRKKKLLVVGLTAGAGAIALGVGAVVAVPASLTYAGFTATGIAAGSLGAKLMSLSAILSGGGVPLGGLVATLQGAGTGAAAAVSAVQVVALGVGGATGAVAAGGTAGVGIAIADRSSRSPQPN